MATVRIIIAGGREFNNYELLAAKMNSLTEYLDFTDLEIVSGLARGADQLGERWAAEAEIPAKRFPAEWDKYGKSAGYIRNNTMAKYATHLVAFWDGKSRGTEHMVAIARQMRLEIRVVKIAPPRSRSIHDEVVWI